MQKKKAATSTGYDKDYYGWILSQADLLRKREFTFIDYEHLIEEVESLGK